MTQISSSNYAHLLITLRDVCKEANAEIAKDKETEIVDYAENPSVLKAMEKFPPISFDEVTKKIKFYTKDKLMVYEAAKRQGLNELANFYLKKWQNKLDKNVKEKIGGEINQPSQGMPPEVIFSSFFPSKAFGMGLHKRLDSKETDAKLQKMIGNIHWPQFKNAVQAEKDLKNGLNHVISKELVFRKFHSDEKIGAPPEHAFNLFGNIYPDIAERYVIEKYAPLQKGVTFGKFDQEGVQDDKIKEYLTRFPQLEMIDLSGCIRLTSACLQNGHTNLKTINLTGTSIPASAITKKQFPNIENVIQDKEPVNIFKFSKDVKNLSWKEICDGIFYAEIILCDDDGFERLIDKFRENPSLEGLHTLHTFDISRKRIQKDNHFHYAYKQEQLVNEFINVWRRRQPEEWNKAESLGKGILNTLGNIWVDPDVNKAIKNVISEAFTEDLTAFTKTTSTDRYGSKDKEVTSYFSERDIHRVRYLMKFLENYKTRWKNGFEDISWKINKHLVTLESELFHKKERSSLDTLVNRDRTVAMIEHLQAVQVALSYHTEDPTVSYFSKLLDPARTTRRSEPLGNDSMVFVNFFLSPLTNKTLYPGPLYAEPMDQTLACVFALHLQNKSREAMLTNVLEHFSTFKNRSTFYPLPKVVLGAIENNDIPHWDKNSPLTRHLLAYKGVFNEKISDELKEKFWTALCKGELGGKTKELVDGLVNFHNRLDTSVEWQQKIKAALSELGGILAKGPVTGIRYHNILNDDPVKKHARTMLKEILGEANG